jgi:hypothetical protein
MYLSSSAGFSSQQPPLITLPGNEPVPHVPVNMIVYQTYQPSLHV